MRAARLQGLHMEDPAASLETSAVYIVWTRNIVMRGECTVVEGML